MWIRFFQTTGRSHPPCPRRRVPGSPCTEFVFVHLTVMEFLATVTPCFRDSSAIPRPASPIRSQHCLNQRAGTMWKSFPFLPHTVGRLAIVSCICSTTVVWMNNAFSLSPCVASTETAEQAACDRLGYKKVREQLHAQFRQAGGKEWLYRRLYALLTGADGPLAECLFANTGRLPAAFQDLCSWFSAIFPKNPHLHLREVSVSVW